MNIFKILTALASLMFIMIGLDKFLSFLTPPCSLEEEISVLVWRALGVVQLCAGVFIWLPRYTKGVAVFFAIFMSIFTIVHLVQGTYDIGGSAFMAVLLAIVAWNPPILSRKILK